MLEGADPAGSEEADDGVRRRLGSGAATEAGSGVAGLVRKRVPAGPPGRPDPRTAVCEPAADRKTRAGGFGSLR
ncbi:hypothetical protein SUDANB58_00172 [Streptomyces sp. enrichment culture]